MLNFNTLGHLSLRPNPGSVSRQTSYFLIRFESEVAQERARGGAEGGGGGGDGAQLSGSGRAEGGGAAT